MITRICKAASCLVLICVVLMGDRSALAANDKGVNTHQDIVGDGNFHLRGDFTNSRIRFEREKKGHVAFIGGSITQMNGYRPMVCKMLEKRFPETAFTFTSAGISSTCSTTGAFRLQRDVLSKGPLDLLFVEFAVNDDQDAHHSRENCIRGMEGIVAHARAYNPNVDIVITHFVNSTILEALRAGKEFCSVQAHNDVAARHGVSVNNLAQELADQINAGKMDWKQFGGVHPNQYGNTMCATMIADALLAEWSRPLPASRKITPHKAAPLLDPKSYTRGRFYDSSKVETDQNWKISVPELDRETTGSLRPAFQGVALLHSSTPGAKLSVTFKGTAIGAYILAGKDSAIVKVSIDGGEPKELDSVHYFSRSLNYPRTVIFYNELDDAKHTLDLEIRERTTEREKQRGGSAFRVLHFAVN